MFSTIVRSVSKTTLTLALALGALGSATPAQAQAQAPGIKVRDLHRARQFRVTRPLTTTTAPAVEIQLNDIETALVPSRLVRGDREFGGNGPDIVSRVNLELSRDRRSIVAKIYFKATETKSDWSTTEQSWERTVFTAPAGKTIAEIVGPKSSEVRFRSVAAGFQILGPGEDFQAFVRELENIVNLVLDAERTLSDRDSDTREVREARQWLDRIESGIAGLEFQGNHVHTVHPETDGPVNVFAIVGDTGGDDISKDDNPKDDTRIQAIMFNPVQVRYR